MVTQELLNYITEQDNQGASKDVITRVLLSYGWQMNDLQEAFSIFEKQKAEKAFWQNKYKKVKKIITVLIIVSVILLLLLALLAGFLGSCLKLQPATPVVKAPTSQEIVTEIKKIPETVEIKEEAPKLVTEGSRAPNILALSPSIMTVNNVLRNSVQEKSFSLIRAIPDRDEYYEVVVESAYAHYIEGEKQILLPKGQRQVFYNFKINAQEAAVGDYQIGIVFYPLEYLHYTESSGTGIGIKSGLKGIVNFNVSGEQVLDYKIVDVNLGNIEEGSPIDFFYVVDNAGNVEGTPDICQLTFVNAQNKTLVYVIEKANLPLAKAGLKNKYNLEISHEVPANLYEVKIEFFDENKLIAEFNQNKVVVFEKGTLNQQGELRDFYTNKDSYESNENIRMTGVFVNTGQILLKAVLVAEVFKDNVLQDVIKSQELRIDNGETVHIPLITKLNFSGQYKIQAHVEYGNKISLEKTVGLNIEPQSMAARLQIYFDWMSSHKVIIFGSLIVLLLVVIGFIIFKFRRPKFSK